MKPPIEQPRTAFVTTQWTALGQLNDEDERVRLKARDQLAAAYWQPIYTAATRLTRDREAALDLTQSFFADVILSRELFERADRSRGSLRSLIRSALRRYATDRWRRAHARNGDRSVTWSRFDVADRRDGDGDADAAFDRQWALGLFEEALRRCEQHFVSSGKPQHWKLFAERVVQPALHAVEPPTFPTLAPMHGFESPASAAAVVQTVRRRFEAVFRAVIAETLCPGADLEDELRCVMECIEAS